MRLVPIIYDEIGSWVGDHYLQQFKILNRLTYQDSGLPISCSGNNIVHVAREKYKIPKYILIFT